MNGIQFSAPFSCLIAGPSGSGKTELTKRLIREASKMIDPPPSGVVWFYGSWQPGYDSISDLVRFVKGPPPTDDDAGDSGYYTQNSLIVLDDLMFEICGKTLAKIFTKHCHHKQISCIHLIQNIFFQDKHFRSVALNAKYQILFKNPRDRSQIKFLAAQIGRANALVEAYNDATAKPHGYLLLDFSQSTDERFRMRTNIFPDEECLVYVPKYS